jgi:hypothetical protein
LLAWPALALAQTTPGDRARDCAGLANDETRLACYDAIFRESAAASGMTDRSAVPRVESPPVAAAAGTAAAAVTAGAGVAASAAAVPAAGVTAGTEDEFGMTGAVRRARDTAGDEPPPLERISARVETVRRQPAGELVLTLDNGQVWAQLEPDPRLRLATGDAVTIRKAALGSYMLVTANRYGTRVRRVK